MAYQAERAAGSIADHYRQAQAQAQAQIAVALADAEDLQQAERVARSITEPGLRAKALAEIARPSRRRQHGNWN